MKSIGSDPSSLYPVSPDRFDIVRLSGQEVSIERSYCAVNVLHQPMYATWTGPLSQRLRGRVVALLTPLDGILLDKPDPPSRALIMSAGSTGNAMHDVSIVDSCLLERRDGPVHGPARPTRHVSIVNGGATGVHPHHFFDVSDLGIRGEFRGGTEFRVVTIGLPAWIRKERETVAASVFVWGHADGGPLRFSRLENGDRLIDPGLLSL